jgi:hypothetical protein
MAPQLCSFPMLFHSSSALHLWLAPSVLNFLCFYHCPTDLCCSIWSSHHCISIPTVFLDPFRSVQLPHFFNCSLLELCPSMQNTSNVPNLHGWLTFSKLAKVTKVARTLFAPIFRHFCDSFGTFENALGDAWHVRKYSEFWALWCVTYELNEMVQYTTKYTICLSRQTPCHTLNEKITLGFQRKRLWRPPWSDLNGTCQ